jgi:hypothetical protein
MKLLFIRVFTAFIFLYDTPGTVLIKILAKYVLTMLFNDDNINECLKSVS